MYTYIKVFIGVFLRIVSTPQLWRAAAERHSAIADVAACDGLRCSLLGGGAPHTCRILPELKNLLH